MLINSKFETKSQIVFKKRNLAINSFDDKKEDRPKFEQVSWRNRVIYEVRVSFDVFREEVFPTMKQDI